MKNNSKASASRIKKIGKRAIVPSIVVGLAVIIGSLVVILRKLRAFSKITALFKRKEEK